MIVHWTTASVFLVVWGLFLVVPGASTTKILNAGFEPWAAHPIQSKGFPSEKHTHV